MKGVTRENIISLLEMLRESSIDEMCLQSNHLKFRVSKSGKKYDSDTAEVISETSDRQEQLLPVKAPMLGFFRRSPLAGAAPFVSVNQYIKENDTLCIIHVLDQQNILKADFRGYVRQIFPSDGEMVEFQQTLFLVEPVDNTVGGVS